MDPTRKDDVIAKLIHGNAAAGVRESWFRDWCEAVGAECTRTDLKRVRAGRLRELNRDLLAEE